MLASSLARHQDGERNIFRGNIGNLLKPYKVGPKTDRYKCGYIYIYIYKYITPIKGETTPVKPIYLKGQFIRGPITKPLFATGTLAGG